MAFCESCGHELSSGAKFCSACGTAVGPTTSSRDGNGRALHKCPQCGEVLNAFVAKCPSCGYELRGSQTLSRVRELEDALGGMESSEKRAELIRNFYIPNTKEDIYEFFILATSNLKAGDVCSDAWTAKLEQAYSKARLVFNDNDELQRLTATYNRLMRRQPLVIAGKAIARSHALRVICLGAAGVFLIAVGLILSYVTGGSGSPFFIFSLVGAALLWGAFMMGFIGLAAEHEERTAGESD